MHKICFTISLFHASTFFEHHVLIRQEVKIVFYSSWYHHTETSELSKITNIYKYEHIVVFIYFSNFSYFSNFRPLTCFSVMIPDAVKYNFDLLMMSTYGSKHEEA